jgi:hypothetical protein
MSIETFFERPILNSPYEFPGRHWELDDDGQPTNQILEIRRKSELITPVPKPRKRRRSKNQAEMVFDDLSTEDQQYNPTPIINEIRQHVESWRALPNPDQWQVTPETARLLLSLAQTPVPKHSALLLSGRSSRDGDLDDRGCAEAGHSGQKVFGTP